MKNTKTEKPDFKVCAICKYYGKNKAFCCDLTNKPINDIWTYNCLKFSAD